MKILYKKIKFWLAQKCGYKYLANNKSKEVHCLDSKHTNCHLLMIKDYVLLFDDELDCALKEGYNGCRFCLKQYDSDIKKK